MLGQVAAQEVARAQRQAGVFGSLSRGRDALAPHHASLPPSLFPSMSQPPQLHGSSPHGSPGYNSQRSYDSQGPGSKGYGVRGGSAPAARLGRPLGVGEAGRLERAGYFGGAGHLGPVDEEQLRDGGASTAAWVPKHDVGARRSTLLNLHLGTAI